MKRVKIIAVLILLCAAHAFAQSGVIAELSGTVELKPAGAADYAAAKAGDEVATDTIVSTGFRSSALIRLGSSVITVRPLTRLSLKEISAGAGTETLNVSLQTGRVRVDVNPPAGSKASFTLQSPIATASVRGTSFEFDTQSLTVLEGTVSFQGSSGGPMAVNAGRTSEITSDGRAADPIVISLAELMPPPLTLSNTGFRQSTRLPSGALDNGGGLNFVFILK